MKLKATSDTNIAAIKKANESPNFSCILANIINSSFEEGVFPSQLKTAKVVPIHKGGSKFDIQNYRPISLLSAFSKFFEKVMHKRISNFIDGNESLNENQYGFRKGRSCEHALLAAQNELITSLSKNQISILLLIDFSKAFDMVDHRILLHKLQNYGIRGNAYNWLKSYLNERKQYVSINGEPYTTRSLEYGVPQGSILGPLLFIIYINDIPEICKFARFILYADDANIIVSANNMQELEKKFNILSKSLETWVSTNGLCLNLKKTNYMIFAKRNIELSFTPSISNYQIARKQSARFLGVLVDEKLTWKQHISAIKSKMSRYIGVLYKLRDILPITARKNIFNSFVQSHINYCSIVWGLTAKSNIEPLFSEQKKAIRALVPEYTVHNINNNDEKCPSHTKSAFTELDIPTVQTIILKNILIFMNKLHNFPYLLPKSILNLIATNAPSIGSTYDTCLDWLSDFSTKLSRNTIVFKGPLFYTDLLPNITLMKGESFKTPSSFKNYLKKYLHLIQSSGDKTEWSGINMPLYCVPGLRESCRH